MSNVTPEPGDKPEASPLRTQWDATPVRINGVKVLAVLPVVPEDESPEVREAIARRRIVMLEGQCPCGAIRQIPNRATRRAAKRKGRSTQLHATIVHEADCIASDENLHAMGFRGWGE